MVLATVPNSVRRKMKNLLLFQRRSTTKLTNRHTHHTQTHAMHCPTTTHMLHIPKTLPSGHVLEASSRGDAEMCRAPLPAALRNDPRLPCSQPGLLRILPQGCAPKRLAPSRPSCSSRQRGRRPCSKPPCRPACLFAVRAVCKSRPKEGGATDPRTIEPLRPRTCLTITNCKAPLTP